MVYRYWGHVTAFMHRALAPQTCAHGGVHGLFGVWTQAQRELRYQCIASGLYLRKYFLIILYQKNKLLVMQCLPKLELRLTTMTSVTARYPGFSTALQTHRQSTAVQAREREFLVSQPCASLSICIYFARVRAASAQ